MHSLILKTLTFILLTGGLLFSKGNTMHSLPYISPNGFRSICHHAFDEFSKLDPKQVKKNDLVFVNSFYIRRYFATVHPRIPVPYILITHKDDKSIPGKYAYILNQKKIVAWYTNNYNGYKHRKLFSLPLGIANAYYKHGNTKLIDEALRAAPKRDILIYSNFSIGTKSDVRSFCLANLKKRSDVYFAQNASYKKYLNHLSRSKFVASPRGHGLDCHRTWEALLLGAIPIVKKSSLDILYNNLNVLIINEWNQIPSTEELEEIYVRMQKQKTQREKLYFPYWKNHIYSQIKNIAN